MQDVILLFSHLQTYRQTYRFTNPYDSSPNTLDHSTKLQPYTIFQSKVILTHMNFTDYPIAGLKTNLHATLLATTSSSPYMCTKKTLPKVYWFYWVKYVVGKLPSYTWAATGSHCSRHCPFDAYKQCPYCSSLNMHYM